MQDKNTTDDQYDPSQDNDKHTNFGYQQVPRTAKQGLVHEVFSSVASSYDIMNDLMSLGMHRLWKKIAANTLAIQPGDSILDIAGGTGDMTKYFAKATGNSGRVILADINEAMLTLGRDKIIDNGYNNNVTCIQANVECLPFSSNSFEHACIAFGLRNVTNKELALKSIFEVLKPNGCLLILEFSKPTSELLSKLYDSYSFNILPKLGELIAKDSSSYQYLAESIRMHPDQSKLSSMIQAAGFKAVNYRNLTGGIVAIHSGIKSQ